MSKPVALVTGSGSGLGAAICAELASQYEVVEFDIQTTGDDVCAPQYSALPSRIDVLVNCAGVNRINWLEDVTTDEWDLVMEVNVTGVFRMVQWALPRLRESRGTVVNIVSDASHKPMRCSAAYNASKGAAAILTKQMARELAPDVTVFSVSPNKLSGTGMSDSIDEQVVKTRGWTKEQAQSYQLQGLLIGEETPPRLVAEFIGFLLSSKERHKHLAGCDIPYGA